MNNDRIAAIREHLKSADFEVNALDCVPQITRYYLYDVKYLLTEIDRLNSELLQKTQQLEASHRREQAAVEDLRNYPGITPCYVCKHFIAEDGPPDEHCTVEGRSCFEWRGPEQEGGE